MTNKPTTRAAASPAHLIVDGMVVTPGIISGLMKRNAELEAERERAAASPEPGALLRLRDAIHEASEAWEAERDIDVNRFVKKAYSIVEDMIAAAPRATEVEPETVHSLHNTAMAAVDAKDFYRALEYETRALLRAHTLQVSTTTRYVLAKSVAGLARDIVRAESEDTSTASPEPGAVDALVRKIAAEAYKHWDADRDSKVGKLLAALAGTTGIRLDLDGVRAAATRADATCPKCAEGDGRLTDKPASFAGLALDVLACIPADWKPNQAREWGKLGPILAEFIDDLREGRYPAPRADATDDDAEPVSMCEGGCGPATTADRDGVPLCDACAASLDAETLQDIATLVGFDPARHDDAIDAVRERIARADATAGGVTEAMVRALREFGDKYARAASIGAQNRLVDRTVQDIAALRAAQPDGGTHGA